MSKATNHRLGKPSPLLFHMGAIVSEIHSEMLAGANQPEAAIRYGNRLKGFISGLEKWQQHPFRRNITAPKIVWSCGSSKLLDYGTIDDATDPDGPPIVIIPSLINRAYILDLDYDNSLLRFLARSGFRPFLLDWGGASDAEYTYDFDDYISERMIPAITALKTLSNQTPALLGYCMGGTLAAGALATGAVECSAFATIGSPWDFSKVSQNAAVLRSLTRDPEVYLEAIGQTFGMIPADFFQYLFAVIDPTQAATKFDRFDRCDQQSVKALNFVAVEDWLSDAIAMPPRAAKNLLLDWNYENQPANGKWKLLGNVVELANVDTPTTVICGQKDRIVPIDAAKGLANIPDAHLLTPDLGHVGMIVSSKAKTDVWQPIADFFRNNMS